MGLRPRWIPTAAIGSIWSGTCGQSGHWPLDQPFTARSLHALLAERIGRLDVASAHLAIEGFIAQPEPLAIWSQDYFQQLVQHMVAT